MMIEIEMEKTKQNEKKRQDNGTPSPHHPAESKRRKNEVISDERALKSYYLKSPGNYEL